MPDTAFTGILKRGEAEGTIEGTLTEHPWGWTINIVGTRSASGGYTLIGTLGDPPASLRIGAIDDAPVPEPPEDARMAGLLAEPEAGA